MAPDHPGGRGMSEDLVADPTAPRRARRLLRSWLHVRGLGPDETWALVQAVDAAVTNSVQHAYRDAAEPGQVMLDWWVRTAPAGDRVVVLVTDTGWWPPGAAGADRTGRGLPLMGVCCDSVEIERGRHGTTVTLVSRYINGS